MRFDGWHIRGGVVEGTTAERRRSARRQDPQLTGGYRVRERRRSPQGQGGSGTQLGAELRVLLLEMERKTQHEAPLAWQTCRHALTVDGQATHGDGRIIQAGIAQGTNKMHSSTDDSTTGSRPHPGRERRSRPSCATRDPNQRLAFWKQDRCGRTGVNLQYFISALNELQQEPHGEHLA